MYPNGNNQLQILKWWVPLRSSLYIFYFRSDLFHYLSIISTGFPTDKILKETVHFFKTIMLYPSTAPLPHVKLKRVSNVYHVLYNDSTVDVQKNLQEKYARSYIKFIQLGVIESIKNARTFSSYTSADWYDFTHGDVFEPDYLTGYLIQVTL